MKLTFEHHHQCYQADTSKPISLAIILNPAENQPNHFGAPPASAVPLQMGNFIGSVAQGGSCNVDQWQLIPHCNGTHTETVAHIVRQPQPIGDWLRDTLMVAGLITVRPVLADQTNEAYQPPLDPADRVITAEMLNDQLGQMATIKPTALIIRTQPNELGKRHRNYVDHPPSFFTQAAIDSIVAQGYFHLLVDLPSIDRMYDEGKMTNHHAFWNIDPATRHFAHGQDSTLGSGRTVTEMIFVPDEIDDGIYLLNLQVAPLASDASPSRPIIWPITPVSSP